MRRRCATINSTGWPTLNLVPSFFIGHTFFWGDWHRDETLGFRRAERISPARSAIERGIAFTLHNDAPVVPPDMMRTLWSAVTRRTRSNDILGPAQRLTRDGSPGGPDDQRRAAIR